MEGGIQSSFIPKDAGRPTAAPRIERGGGLGDLLLLISIVLFVASAALAGAVFLYQQYLQSSATSKVAQLKRAQQAFEPALIQQLTRLDDRMRAADAILSQHLAPTAFFTVLGQATLTTVSFKTLDLEAGDPKHITIKMQGVAQSVNSIALQADLFSKNGVITSPIFSDISRQPDGVHFNLSAFINPATINYVSLVNGALAQQTAQSPQSQTPTNQGQGSPFNSPSQTQSQTQTQTQTQGQTQTVTPTQNQPAQVQQPGASSGARISH
ncbi:MAG: hypothetical protein JO019_00415 [Candidatus Kaiserbacteria bacterium]|nr:hypothetical protein [Candidatus Kaiserbacteria bacterium]